MDFKEWCESLGRIEGKVESELLDVDRKMNGWKKRIWRVSRDMGSCLCRLKVRELKVSKKKMKSYWKEIDNLDEEIGKRLERLHPLFDDHVELFGMDTRKMAGYDEQKQKEMGIGMFYGFMHVLTTGFSLKEMRGNIDGIVGVIEGWIEEERETEDFASAVLDFVEKESEKARKRREKKVGEMKDVEVWGG